MNPTDKIKILLVDDEIQSCRQIQAVMARTHPEVELITANTVTDAIKYWEYQPRYHFAALILDIDMPPGKEFQSEDNQHGTRTGYLLYKRFTAWVEYLFKDRPMDRRPLPTIVHTHIKDPSPELECARISFSYLPIKVAPKKEDAFALVDEMFKWMEEVRRRDHESRLHLPPTDNPEAPDGP